MRNTVLIISTIAILIVTMTGCTTKETKMPTNSIQQSSSDNVVSTTAIKTLEKYYDYFRENTQIITLFDHQDIKMGFTDDELAAFAIYSMDNYNYEKGNSKKEYDVITEKYFGRKIKNFNNRKSEIIPGTNMVRATGWDCSDIYMVLKDLKTDSNGIKTAKFYRLISQAGDCINKTGDEIKSSLLSGDFSDFQTPIIVEMIFEEKYDEGGNMYIKYNSLNELDETINEIKLYGTK